jgi:uncharacterized protein
VVGQAKARVLISEESYNRIVIFGKDHGAIVAIYLFGSMATGRSRAPSDIDIALMVRSPIRGAERIEMENSLANLLGRDVDLIIFSEATPLLQHQILKQGCLIYEYDPEERVRQEAAARYEYLDGRHLYRLIRG